MRTSSSRSAGFTGRLAGPVTSGSDPASTGAVRTQS
jgi:hypothetical protein